MARYWCEYYLFTYIQKLVSKSLLYTVTTVRRLVIVPPQKLFSILFDNLDSPLHKLYYIAYAYEILKLKILYYEPPSGVLKTQYKSCVHWWIYLTKDCHLKIYSLVKAQSFSNCIILRCVKQSSKGPSRNFSIPADKNVAFMSWLKFAFN